MSERGVMAGRKGLRYAIVLLCLVAGGCAGVGRGNYVMAVGEVEVEKSTPNGSGTVKDRIKVNADEHGTGIIETGQGARELEPVYLTNFKRNMLRDKLIKMTEFGETARSDRAETHEMLGSVSAQTDAADSTAVITLDFNSSAEGREWLGTMRICETLPGLQNTMNKNQCGKFVELYLPQNSIAQLIKYLGAVPEYSTKASRAKYIYDKLNE